MLLGEWKDTSGKYIQFTYVFSDYNDEKGIPWYSTNLKTSQESGKSYQLYLEPKEEKLVIGYVDVQTGVKTENFIITFEETAISVENKIDQKTYTLNCNFNYQKVIKGKAKLAYEHVSAMLLTFASPETTVITNCYVDYPTDNVYITIEYENGEGAKVTEQYEISIKDGEYQKRTFPYLATTNIDINELNQMLKDFLKNSQE